MYSMFLRRLSALELLSVKHLLCASACSLALVIQIYCTHFHRCFQCQNLWFEYFRNGMAEEVRAFPSPAFQKSIKKTGHVNPMAGGTPRNKRIRPWELCDDVQELKRMLTEKDDLLDEQNARNAKLQKDLEFARTSAPTSTPTFAPTNSSTNLTPAKLQKEVEKLLRSIPRKVTAVMTYKSKDATSTLVPVEIAGIEESVMRGVFGETLSSLGAEGTKQIKVVASNEDLEAVFQGGCFSKRLRFGATLELQKGLTFAYTKETKSLKITGTYKMCK